MVLFLCSKLYYNGYLTSVSKFLTLHEFLPYLANTAGLWATFSQPLLISQVAHIRRLAARGGSVTLLGRNLWMLIIAVGCGKTGSWKNHVNTCSIDLSTQNYKILHQLSFLAPLLQYAIFHMHIDQKVQLLVIPNKRQIHKTYGTLKPVKASICINFPHTFFNGTNWKCNLKPQYLLTRERYPRFWVRSEMRMV